MLKKNLFISSIILAMVACSQSETNGSSHASEPTNTSASSVKAASAPNAKVYRVGTGFTYPPYNQRNKEVLEGLEIDIMNAIAQNQNFQVEYVPLKWDTLINNAQAQNLSVVMDGIAADDLTDYPDYTLSESYMRSGDCIYVAKPENAATWNKNKIALHPDDSLDEELVKEYGVQQSNIKHIRTSFEALKSVLSDEVQATVSDCGTLRYMAKNPLFKDYTFHENKLSNSERSEVADLGFGVLKTDVELMNKINTGLQNIKQSGELDTIIKKWN